MNKVNGGADEPRKQGHTAGPWSVDSKESVGLYFIPEVESAQGRVTCFENKYDAALIAAAPETYAELKEIAGHIVNASKRHEPLDSEWLLKRAKTALETCSKAETV